MIIPKEDIHYLVEQLREKDTHLVYQLVSHIIQKGNFEDMGLDIDIFQIPEKEKTLLNQAKANMEMDELVDWYDQYI